MGFQFGTAVRDITPPVGEELAGYIAREQPSTGVLDPLQAEALAFSSEGSVALLVAADLLAFDQPLVDDLRDALRAATGTPSEAIAVAARHPHAAPTMQVLRHLGRPSDAYVSRVRSALIEAACEAVSSLAPGSLAATRGEIKGLSRNRRHPDTGPVDPEAIVLSLARLDDGRETTLVQWNCHPVCLGPDNRLVSADYVGVFRRAVRVSRPQNEVVFLTGCAGDQNPMEHSMACLERTGRGLAEAVLDLPPLEPIAGEPVRAVLRKVRLPLDRSVTVEQAREQRALHAERLRTAGPGVSRNEPAAMLDWAEELLSALESGSLPDDPEADVQGIRMGDAVFVFLPCEPLCQLGLDLKAWSPFRYTVPVGYANGVVGYLGPEAEYDAPGYELELAPRYYGLLPFSREAGTVLMSAVNEVVASL